METTLDRGAGEYRRTVAHAALALLFLLFALPPLLAPQNFPSDDSLFYLQVARNIASGHGSTFNTVTPTNGYHPLWMGPCVVAAWISGGEPILMLRVAFAMQMLLAAGSVLLFRAIARRLEIRAWPLGIPPLATFFLTGMYGSEAHINGACVLASVLLLLRVRERPATRDCGLLGVMLGLTVLARLDNAFLVAAMLAAIATALPTRDRPRMATLLRIVVPLAIVLAPYLAWNLARFGHLMPISGAVKCTFPRIEGDVRNLGVLGLITCLAAAGGGAAALLRRMPSERRLVLGAMAAGVLAHGLYVVLYTNHNTHWSWYYVPGVLLTTMLACLAADAVSARNIVLRSRALAVVMIVVLSVAGVARGWARFLNNRASSHNQFVVEFLAPETDERWEIQFARHMQRTLPPGARLLVFDYPGHFAYYSSLRIIASDGLVGDYEYDARLRLEGLRPYLAAQGVEYYVGRNLMPPDSCRLETVFAPLGRVDVGALVLCPSNVLATTPAVVRGVPEPDIALFRIGEIAGPRGTPPPPMLKHGLLW